MSNKSRPRSSAATADDPPAATSAGAGPSGAAKAKSAPGRQARSSSESKGPAPWIRENIEAVAVAIIMALVIRHFCVEAFKIPTGSMAPTLLGGEAGLFDADDGGGLGRAEDGIVGDRILVNKFVYLLEDPERWDVIVFKYPLNTTRNFIKRLVGLPGETIEIRDGDIWIDGAPARKPRNLQRRLWTNWPIYRQERSDAFFGPFKIEPGETARWSQSESQVNVSAGHATLATFTRPVAFNTTGFNGSHVSDLALSVVATPGEGSGAFHAVVDSMKGRAEYLIAVEGSDEPTRLLLDGEVVAESAEHRLPRGRASDIRAENVDGALYLSVDGEEWLRHLYDLETETRRDRRKSTAVELGTSGPAFTFAGVAIHRDLYYTNHGVLGPGQKVSIPGDSYFVLGDNSPASKDSRLWTSRTYELLDGRTLTADPGESETFVRQSFGMTTTITMEDIYGEIYRFDERSARAHPDQDAPFVPARNVVGKAFFVFWPVLHREKTYSQFSGDPREIADGYEFNLKFIR